MKPTFTGAEEYNNNNTVFASKIIPSVREDKKHLL